MARFEEISFDVLLEIVSHLQESPLAVYYVAVVCKSFQAMISDAERFRRIVLPIGPSLVFSLSLSLSLSLPWFKGKEI